MMPLYRESFYFEANVLHIDSQLAFYQLTNILSIWRTWCKNLLELLLGLCRWSFQRWKRSVYTKL